MATLAELRAQEAKLANEIRAASERVRNAATDEEARAAQEDRQRLRNQLSFVSAEITKDELQNATNFVVTPDSQTGGYQIRTSDGLFAGAGPTLESAKLAAISNGAPAAGINSLDDPSARAAATQGPQTDSSGAIQSNASQARDDGANQQNPPAGPAVLTPQGRIQQPLSSAGTVPTNAEGFDPGNQDAGTDATVRTAESSQGTPQIVARPGPPPPNQNLTSQNAGDLAAASVQDDAAGYTYYGGTPGAAAARDDNTAPNANATRQAVNDRFGDNIVPRPNLLDQYASYTYSISIYIMSPVDYNRLMAEKRRVIPANQLLIQSGGAPVAGRNPYFGLDYYIDGLRLKSVISGKGTRGPHNVVEMQFRITEPNGISLISNLYRATQDYVARTSSGRSGEPQNYAAQNYLMVIRFYGYDENGNLVPAQNTDPAGATDRDAVVEKFIPFQFTSIKFRIANRVTEYDCTAVCPQNVVATGQGRGVIPYNVQLTGTTVKNLLTGNAVLVGTDNQSEAETQRLNATAGGSSSRNETAGQFDPNNPSPAGSPGGGSFFDSPEYLALIREQAPGKADAAPSKKTVISGLVDALNKYQRELVTKKIYDVADEYEIKIVEPQIQNARVRPPGQTNLKNVAQPRPGTAAEAKDGRKTSVDNDSKAFSITAGTSIVQFLDMVMRNSTYIYDQQSVIYDPKTNDPIPQGVPANAFAWYRIGVQSTPKVSDGYDEKRKDYAYKITYQISMYKVNNVKSPYFPDGRFQGTQKKYDYWFTGANTSILNFEQDFNYLYYITLNTNEQVRPTGTTLDYREYEKRQFAPNSPESSQQNAGDVGEPSANAADRLYSPADQGRVKMTIVGDPAWIQQGDVWSGLGGPGVKDQTAVNFLPDGTINYESQEVLFEIGFNKPEDYDLDTGLMPIKRAQ
jgi:hypothetical protein